MPQFIQQFASFPWAAVLTAVVTIATGVHVAALALGQKWPFFLKVASISGVLAIDVQKFLGFLGGAPAYTSIAAKKLGKAMVDDAKGPTANIASAGLLLLAFVLPGCSPSQMQQAVTIADDIGKIATVLCLADHARTAHAKAMTVAEACQTIEQLAPYMDQAKGMAPQARCAP